MLAKMKMHQVSESMAYGKPVFRFRSVIAGDGVSKTARGGLRPCDDKPVEALCWRTSQLDGKLCIYDDLKLYLSATSKHRGKRDNFFICQLQF